jgi:hypothetical protein
MTKPTFLLELFHSTDVPAFRQKSELPFAFGMLGVAEAALAVRFTSTLHGLEAEPQVLAAVHSCAGFGCVHTFF